MSPKEARISVVKPGEILHGYLNVILSQKELDPVWVREQFLSLHSILSKLPH